MFGLGFNELLIILIIIMIVFGAGKLPEIGSGLGKGIKNFKRAIGGSDEIDITPKKNTDEEKKGNEERKVS
ncbi:MAG: twin-arginine translocase TatA/TatE family subunit [Candidatus Tectomicrobia bacterium]|nr:twin-arginine translocase TatA/TatE family subunit [Candidatus Tectomicrobia bacterium]